MMLRDFSNSSNFSCMKFHFFSHFSQEMKNQEKCDAYEFKPRKLLKSVKKPRSISLFYTTKIVGLILIYDVFIQNLIK